MKGIVSLFLLITSFLVSAQDFDLLIKKGNNLIFEKDFEGALVEYEKMLNLNLNDSSQLSQVYGYMGVCYQELNKLEKAKYNYSEAIKLKTPIPSFYSKLLSIYKKEKNVEGQEFVLLKKRIVFSFEDQKTVKSLAYLYLNSKQYKKLLSACDELISWQPHNYKYHYFKAIAYQKLKEEDRAVAAYMESINLKPNDYKSNCYLGMILFFRANTSYDKAVKNYEAIKKPTDADYQACKQQLATARHKLLKAEPYLLKAFENKKDAKVKKALYKLYNKTNRRAKADQYR